MDTHRIMRMKGRHAPQRSDPETTQTSPPRPPTRGLAVRRPPATAPPPPRTLPAPPRPAQTRPTTRPRVDPPRPDPWVPTAPARELMVQLWYPASTVTGYPNAPWMTPATARSFEKVNGLPVLKWPITDGHVG